MQVHEIYEKFPSGFRGPYLCNWCGRPMTKCEFCGEEFPEKRVGGGRKKRFCSKRCAGYYNNNKHAASALARAKEKVVG